MVNKKHLKYRTRDMNANNNTSQCPIHKFSFYLHEKKHSADWCITSYSDHPPLHPVLCLHFIYSFQTSFNWNLHVVSPITGWRQRSRASACHLPSWGSPIAEVDTFAAVSEQDADRKSSYKGGLAAGGLILSQCFPEKDVKQLWKQNSVQPLKVSR